MEAPVCALETQAEPRIDFKLTEAATLNVCDAGAIATKDGRVGIE